MGKKKRIVQLNEEDVATKDGLKKYIYGVAAAFLVLAFIITISILSIVLPFEPIRLYDYTSTPTTPLCPFDRVYIAQELEIVDKWYYTLDRIEGETYKLDSADQPFGGTYFNRSLEPMPRDIYSGDAARLAPPEAGEWRAGAHGTAYGKMFGIIPKQQVVDRVTAEPNIVLDWTDPQCQAKFQGE